MNVDKILGRFDAALGKKQQKNRVDFKELAELKKKNTLKLENGKNQVALITPAGAEDPFSFWGYHAGLQETSYWQVACNNYNSDEDCLICNVIKELKDKDYNGNKNLWFPIRQQIEIWAPVINLENDATIAQGPKWLKFSKSAFSAITEWIKNVEAGEAPFFSHEEPNKVIITYNKGAAPADQYRLDRKPMKAFSEQQLADWVGTIKPLATYMQPKSAKETEKIVDEYFARVQAELDAQKENGETSEPTIEANEIVVTPEVATPPVKASRLESLKNKK